MIFDTTHRNSRASGISGDSSDVWEQPCTHVRLQRTPATLRAVDDMVNVVRERVSDVCRPPAGAYDVGTFLSHGLTPVAKVYRPSGLD